LDKITANLLIIVICALLSNEVSIKRNLTLCLPSFLKEIALENMVKERLFCNMDLSGEICPNAIFSVKI
jgi:hypothetical protein